MNEKISQMNSERLCTSDQSRIDSICTRNSPFEQLCQQLVKSDENSSRMEALFKSMFNRNGHMESELCELDYEHQSSDCKSSFKMDNYNDKCHYCIKFYTTQKNYDLEMIVWHFLRERENTIET